MKIHGMPAVMDDPFWTSYGWGDKERYTSGQCHALALALVDILGKPWHLAITDLAGHGTHCVAYNLETLTILDVRGLHKAPRNTVPLSYQRLADGVRRGGWERPVMDQHTYELAANLAQRVKVRGR